MVERQREQAGIRWQSAMLDSLVSMETEDEESSVVG